MVSRKGIARVSAALGAACLTVLSLPIGMTGAGAEGGPSFDGVANAYGVDVTVANQTIPLGIVPEAAGPTAQAHLSSLGDSDAFASLPYPGEIVASLPGLAGALTGGIPFPAYPFLVTTQLGDPARDQDAPGIALHAESGRSEATSKAVLGASGSGYTSLARVEQGSDDSVTASASATFGVNFLNVVQLSGVSSIAKVTADPTSGQLTRTTHLSIGEIAIPGMNITLPTTTPSTVPIPIPVPGLPQLPPVNLPVFPVLFGGQTLATPNLGFEDGTFTITLPTLGGSQKFAIPAGAVLDAMKAVGVRVSYQTAQETTTGVVAPALTFSYTAPAPPSNKYVNGPTDFSVSVGRSTANVTLRPVETSFGSGATSGAFPAVGLPSGGTTTSGGGIQQTATDATAMAPSGGDGGAAAVVPSTPDTSGVAPATTTGGAGASAPVTTAPTNLTALSSVDTSIADLSGMYLICVGIGAAALAGASVLRVLGVRLLWAS